MWISFFRPRPWLIALVLAPLLAALTLAGAAQAQSSPAAQRVLADVNYEYPVRAGIPVAAPGDVDATADHLAAAVRPGDVVLVMGGGHSYRIASGLLLRLGAVGT